MHLEKCLCGSKNLVFVREIYNSTEHMYVECKDCHRTGPWTSDKVTAAFYWNEKMEKAKREKKMADSLAHIPEEIRRGNGTMEKL